MKRLSTAPKGMSYVDALRRRVITIEDDVLGIKSQIQERWPSLEVVFDEVDENWIIYERCDDGVERLFCTTKTLDGRIIERIEKADQQSPGYQDFLEVIDNHNEAVEKEKERRFRDQLGDFAERFRFALKRDGIYDHENIYGTRNK